MDFLNFLSRFCSDEWVALVKNFAVSESFKKGQRIFSEGDKVRNIYFINQGKVKVVSRFNLTDERILRLSQSGDLLGHRAFKSTNFPISAIALEETLVTALPVGIFLKIIKANPDFTLFLLEFYAKDLRATEERMISVIHNDVMVRIAVVLCMLIDSYGYDASRPKVVKFMLSRRDIANFAGTVYESVVRNLTKLEALGIIRFEKKQLMILKEKELRKIISSGKK